jgi:hypothetical protein
MAQLILKYATLNPPLVALLAHKHAKISQTLKIVPSKNLPESTPAELIFPASGYAIFRLYHCAQFSLNDLNCTIISDYMLAGWLTMVSLYNTGSRCLQSFIYY